MLDAMRTTLDIDDDLLPVARELAAQRGTSMGKELSDLARDGLAARRRPLMASGRIPHFPARPGAAPITSDDVAAALDEE